MLLCNGTETCFPKFRRGTMIKLVLSGLDQEHWMRQRSSFCPEQRWGGIRQVQEPGGGRCSWVSNTECIGGGLRLDEGSAAWEIPQG